MAGFDKAQERGIIKGTLFEVAIMYLLQQNSFSRIQVKVNGKNTAVDRIRETRERFIELKGRGEWHQIDCPCEYDYISPFMYPIRLIGEVKYHNQPIDKDAIRNFIGVLKDISENYFVPPSIDNNASTEILPCRFLDVGTFFSATGFSKSAELLAYAHGIKTLSYKNNYMVHKIKCVIDGFEESIRYSTFTKNRQTILGFINQQLSNKESSYYYKDYIPYYNELNDSLKAKLDKFYDEFKQSLFLIRSNIFVTTHEGIMLHLLGDKEFPEDLFLKTDEALCQVHYEIYNNQSEMNLNEVKDLNKKRRSKKRKGTNDYLSWYLTLDGDKTNTRFYFTPPQILQTTLDLDKEKLLDTKEMMFQRLSFRKDIHGTKRNLVLKIDKLWLKELRNRIEE